VPEQLPPQLASGRAAVRRRCGRTPAGAGKQGRARLLLLRCSLLAAHRGLLEPFALRHCLHHHLRGRRREAAVLPTIVSRPAVLRLRLHHHHVPQEPTGAARGRPDGRQELQYGRPVPGRGRDRHRLRCTRWRAEQAYPAGGEDGPTGEAEDGQRVARRNLNHHLCACSACCAGFHGR
jgi:hypothetical protein